MNDQQSLFDSVLVPAGEKPNAFSSVPDLIHLIEGWRATLNDLDGPGRRWLVTPWLTTRHADLLGSVQKGDRLLIRGHASDFLTGMSDLRAVKAFKEWGVEVQRLPALHAKVYAREEAGQGVLWLGSANLSNRGEHGTPRGGQVEAMSGPHPLTSQALTKLESLWRDSLPLDFTTIQREIDELAKERERLNDLLVNHSASGVLAVRLSFRLLTGQYTMTPESLGHASSQAQANRVKYPSVEYIDPDISQLAQQFQNFVRLERRRLNNLLEAVPGIRGLFVLRAEDMELVKEFLGEVEQQARLRFEKQLKAEQAHLRENFAHRFREAFRQFLTEKRQHVAQTPEQATLPALEAFDDYLARDPFRISAQFFIPLVNQDDPDDGLLQAMQQVRARQRLL
ncbi:hypothetical protein [Deinococcus arcticus]|uniref:Phospholipase D-like domain-containing protein n=1 Tax=Deinococcus arcticus TaxID=2136176 RepID=A0A2T3W6N4_9DEIO|nr:hypothetical protein [Deinococcus arcticus]PTA67566.1 hypothetical protein C8263_12070 [Deinococcus arcticus]